MFHGVGTGECLGRRDVSAQPGEQESEVVQPVGDDVDDAAFLLHAPAHADIARAHHDRPEAFEDRRPHDDVGDAGLVLDRHEDHAVRRTRPLPHRHEPGHMRERIVG